MTSLEPTVSYPAMELAIKVVTHYIWPPLFAIGILGDIASVLISLQKHNRKISTCIYVGALAVADTLTVVNGMCLFTVIFNFYSDIERKEFARQYVYNIYTSF